MPEKYKDNICKLIPSKLSSIDFHDDIEGIVRLVSKSFPFHVAVHRIKSEQESPQKYVETHQHDVPEINLFLGGEKPLKYHLQMGEEEYDIESPTAVNIPPQTPHSANYAEGDGYYISIVLTDNYEAIRP